MSEARHLTEAIYIFAFCFSCVYEIIFFYIYFEAILIKRGSVQSSMNYAFIAVQSSAGISSHSEAMELTVSQPNIAPTKLCALYCYICGRSNIFSFMHTSLNAS